MMLSECSSEEFSYPNDTNMYRVIEVVQTKNVKSQKITYALIAVSEDDHLFKRKIISASAESEIINSTNEVNKSPIRGISDSDIALL